MIRLYIPESFKAGDLIALPQEELRYFQAVRRGQGRVVLFNSLGQVAHGEMSDRGFKVLRVETQTSTVVPLRVALACPETSVISDLVRQFSELGVQKLSLFGAERSQKAEARLKPPLLQRLNKIAIESCRQSGRGMPLEIEISQFLDLKQAPEENRILMDEAAVESGPVNLKPLGSSLLVVGCEGGWTESERSALRSFGLQSVHWKTNILKVDTACLLGCGWALSEIFQLNR